VAEWAGHGVDVLLRIYAKCIAGQAAWNPARSYQRLISPMPPGKLALMAFRLPSGSFRVARAQVSPRQHWGSTVVRTLKPSRQ